jgi:hypothetical protein
VATISGKWLFNETLSISASYEGTVWNVNFTYWIDDTIPDATGGANTIEPYKFRRNKYYLYFGTRYAYNITDNIWGEEAYRSIDFGSTPQTVPDYFYAWFTANAVYQGGGASTVTGVTVSPTEVSLYRGEQFQFEATVEGEGEVDQGVYYSIMDIDATTSTAVDQSTGLFTVGEDETKSTIRIFVQSVQDPDVYTIVTVTILDPYDPDSGEGGEGGEGGGEGEEPIPDLMPVYRRTGGAWVKLTAYQRQSGKWVLISTAEG